MKYLVTIAAGILMGLMLAGILFLVIRLPAGKPIELLPAPTEAPIGVHVIGAVPRPGLYNFLEDARVQDAIDAAGGLLAAADVDALNLAAVLGREFDFDTLAAASELDEDTLIEALETVDPALIEFE